MTVKRMDNVGIVVESLDDAIPFFVELGLKLEGRAMIEGEWAGRVTGLGTQRVEMVTAHSAANTQANNANCAGHRHISVKQASVSVPSVRPPR